MPHLGTMELLIILGVMLLLFGAKKVPELARSFGQAVRELRHGLNETATEEVDESVSTRTVLQRATPPDGESAATVPEHQP